MGGWDQNGPYGDWFGGVEWIQLAQDRDGWRAVILCGDEPSGSGTKELEV
jgi:hypothetical protein